MNVLDFPHILETGEADGFKYGDNIWNSLLLHLILIFCMPLECMLVDPFGREKSTLLRMDR